ncbi:hypothetical protein F4808DRAFT_155284 [Astrocystis sublimbata]|nr:hypothetical protein F4808DRAFT_155284 [Astrocystis sublimbata]
MSPDGSTNSSPASSDGFYGFVDFDQHGSGASVFESAPASLSPSDMGRSDSKSQLAPTVSALDMVATPATLPTTSELSGPSHRYEAYKQQTPFVPGALASTMAINDLHGTSNLYGGGAMFGAHMSAATDFADFNYLNNPSFNAPSFSPPTPSQQSIASPTLSMPMDFVPGGSVGDSLMDHAATSKLPYYIPEDSPLAAAAPVAPPPTRVRMYPGYHTQQAEMAIKTQQARAQVGPSRMNQAMMRQRRAAARQQMTSQPNQAHHKAAPVHPDPIAEATITQLLERMRSNPTTSEEPTSAVSPPSTLQRVKKEPEDMDDDERLLASDAGKQLTSKERRQLRNKVSARAFRSRRKELINSMEHDLTAKDREVNDLRAENSAVKAELERLQYFIRSLLTAPQFNNLLETLARDPAELQSRIQPPVDQNQPDATMPKDVGSLHASSFMQTQQHPQQLGMIMLPQQSMPFPVSQNVSFNTFHSTETYAVLEITPGFPEEIDLGALTGKTSSTIDETIVVDSDNGKTDAPTLAATIACTSDESQAPAARDEDGLTVETKTSNLDGDIFDDEDYSTPEPRSLEIDTNAFSAVDIFGGIEPEKMLARHELVNSSEDDRAAIIAARRVERLAASLKGLISKLEQLESGS